MPPYLHLESNLWIENGRLAHLIYVFFNERLEKSCPLITVGQPVEGVMKILADGFVCPFWTSSLPCVCEIDIRTIYS